jgi:hypothetical protein
MRRALKILKNGNCSIFMSEHTGDIITSTYSKDVVKFDENKLIWFKKYYFHIDKHIPDNQIMIVNNDVTFLYNKPQRIYPFYKPLKINEITS